MNDLAPPIISRRQALAAASVNRNRPGLISIAVGVRTRPLLEHEYAQNSHNAWVIDRENNSLIENTMHGSKHGPFDFVFPPEGSNNDVYESLGKPLVRAALHGINATFFAYGQTGSGKTHTLHGNVAHLGLEGMQSPNFVPPSMRPRYSDYPNDAGIIEQAVRDIFAAIEADMDHDFLVRVSYVQLYNETLTDLLNPSTPPSELRIIDSSPTGPYVRGLTEEVVLSPERVLDLVAAGEASRKVAATAMNARSSRSHTLLKLTIEARSRASMASASDPAAFPASGPPTDYLQSYPHGDPTKYLLGAGRPSRNAAPGMDIRSKTGENAPVTLTNASPGAVVRVSSLTLVDLAGSERLSKAGTEGVEAREAGSINNALLTLGIVINKLAMCSTPSLENEHRLQSPESLAIPHIPYRDSKLTRLLAFSLGGNARTAIVVTVSPALMNVTETKFSLLFASRAMRVVNKTKVNEVADDSTLLIAARREIDRLRALLHESKGGIFFTSDGEAISAEALLEKQMKSYQEKENSLLQALQVQTHRAASRLSELRDWMILLFLACHAVGHVSTAPLVISLLVDAVRGEVHPTKALVMLYEVVPEFEAHAKSIVRQIGQDWGDFLSPARIESKLRGGKDSGIKSPSNYPSTRYSAISPPPPMHLPFSPGADSPAQPKHSPGVIASPRPNTAADMIATPIGSAASYISRRLPFSGDENLTAEGKDELVAMFPSLHASYNTTFLRTLPSLSSTAQSFRSWNEEKKSTVTFSPSMGEILPPSNLYDQQRGVLSAPNSPNASLDTSWIGQLEVDVISSPTVLQQPITVSEYFTPASFAKQIEYLLSLTKVLRQRNEMKVENEQWLQREQVWEQEKQQLVEKAQLAEAELKKQVKKSNDAETSVGILFKKMQELEKRLQLEKEEALIDARRVYTVEIQAQKDKFSETDYKLSHTQAELEEAKTELKKLRSDHAHLKAKEEVWSRERKEMEQTMEVLKLRLKSAEASVQGLAKSQEEMEEEWAKEKATYDSTIAVLKKEKESAANENCTLHAQMLELTKSLSEERDKHAKTKQEMHRQVNEVKSEVRALESKKSDVSSSLVTFTQSFTKSLSSTSVSLAEKLATFSLTIPTSSPVHSLDASLQALRVLTVPNLDDAADTQAYFGLVSEAISGVYPAIEQFTSVVNTLEGQVKDKEVALKETEAKVEILKAESSEQITLIASLNTELEATRIKVVSAHALIQNLKEFIAAKESDITEMKAALQDKEKQILSLEDAIASRDAELADSVEKGNAIADELEKRKEQYTIKVAELTHLEAAYAELEKDFKEMEDSNDASMQSMNEEMRKLQSVLTETQSALKNAEERINSDLERLEELDKTLHAKEANAKQKEAELTAHIDTLNAVTSTLENRIESLSAKNSELKQSYDDTSAALAREKEALISAREQVASLRASSEQMARELEVVKDQLSAFKTEKVQDSSTIAKLTEKTNHLQTTITELKDERDKESRRMHELQSERNTLLEQLNEAQNECAELKHDIKTHMQTLKTLSETVRRRLEVPISDITTSSLSSSAIQGTHSDTYSRLFALSQRLEETFEALLSVQSQYTQTRDQLSKANETIATTAAQLQASNEKYSSLQGEFRRIQAQARLFTQQHQELEGEYNAVVDERDALRADTLILQTEIQTAKVLASSLAKEGVGLRAEVSRLRTHLKQARAENGLFHSSLLDIDIDDTNISSSSSATAFMGTASTVSEDKPQTPAPSAPSTTKAETPISPASVPVLGSPPSKMPSSAGKAASPEPHYGILLMQSKAAQGSPATPGSILRETEANLSTISLLERRGNLISQLNTTAEVIDAAAQEPSADTAIPDMHDPVYASPSYEEATEEGSVYEGIAEVDSSDDEGTVFSEVRMAQVDDEADVYESSDIDSFEANHGFLQQMEEAQPNRGGADSPPPPPPLPPLSRTAELMNGDMLLSPSFM